MAMARLHFWRDLSLWGPVALKHVDLRNDKILKEHPYNTRVTGPNQPSRR